MPRTTVQGLLLFLFIPLVLFLFLRQPLGPLASVVLGLVLMFGHRFLAEPWARRHAAHRCAWCGRPVATPVTFDARSGAVPWRLAACTGAHARSAVRFLSFLQRWPMTIGAGIFLPLLLLLASSLAAAAGHTLIPHDASDLVFRVVVAATVVTASLAYRVGADPAAPPRSPFPLHNLLLLGMGWTLWVFRLVGGWWLADGAWRLLNR